MTSSCTHSAWHQNWRVKVEKPVLPSSSTRAYSSLTKKDLNNTNKEVKCAPEVGENEKVATPWGQWRSEGRAWPGTCPAKALVHPAQVTRSRTKPTRATSVYTASARQYQWPGYATAWGGLKRNCQPQTAPLSIKLMNFSPTTTSCHVWPALDYIIPLITSCILGFAHVLAVAEFKICQFFLETDSPNLISYPKFFSLETTFSISMPVCKESPYTHGVIHLPL